MQSFTNALAHLSTCTKAGALWQHPGNYPEQGTLPRACLFCRNWRCTGVSPCAIPTSCSTITHSNHCLHQVTCCSLVFIFLHIVPHWVWHNAREPKRVLTQRWLTSHTRTPTLLRLQSQAWFATKWDTPEAGLVWGVSVTQSKHAAAAFGFKINTLVSEAQVYEKQIAFIWKILVMHSLLKCIGKKLSSERV